MLFECYKIEKSLFFVIACAYVAAVNAAAFPSIIDARVKQGEDIETSTPNIIVSEGSYADLVEIEDIDNDGIRDYLFQLYDYEGGGYTTGDGNPVTYQVSRNGEVLFVGDAQSYFDDKLQPAKTYTYEVVAISTAGVASEESTVIEISTPSDGGVEGSGEAEQVLPTGARGTVYSNSALELFWDRSTDNIISRYLIYRNTELVGETDGITFYDSALDADTEYRYSIQATDKDRNFIGNAALVLMKTTQ